MKVFLRNHLFVFRHFKTINNVTGIRSITSDGMHVQFLDLDNTSLSDGITKCKDISEKEDFGNCYIFESSENNHHAIWLDKVTFGNMLRIMADNGMNVYASFTAKRGFAVVRVSEKGNVKPKPKFVCCLFRKSPREKSLAHWMFLQREYDLDDVLHPGVTDGLLEYKFDIYSATSDKKMIKELIRND